MKFIKTQGFTLIELLVVVLIIGILAAVALPQYQFTIYKSRVAEVLQVLPTLTRAHHLYYLQNGIFTNQIDLLDVKSTSRNKKSWIDFDRADPSHYYYSCSSANSQCAASAANPSLPLFTYHVAGGFSCISWREYSMAYRCRGC